MYAPNEYYKPYAPSSRTRDRYRERQRVPAQYVTASGERTAAFKEEKPLASFRMLGTPPPPASFNTTFSSLNTVDDLLPNKRHRSSCECRISSLIKAFIILGIVLGATVGLIIFFLKPHPYSEIFKDTKSDANITNVDNISPTKPEPRIDGSENFRQNEGEASKPVMRPHRPDTQDIKSSNNSDQKPRKMHAEQEEESETESEKDSSMRSQYEKVLGGFDDGEFSLSVEDFLEEIKGVKTSSSPSVTDINDEDFGNDSSDTNQTNDGEDIESVDNAKEEDHNPSTNASSSVKDLVLRVKESSAIMAGSVSVTPSESTKTEETIISPTLAPPDKDSVSLASSLSEKSDNSASDSLTSLHPTVTSAVTSLKTETVYGSINLVTRLRDTVLVFTTSPSSSSTIAHSPEQKLLSSEPGLVTTESSEVESLVTTGSPIIVTPGPLVITPVTQEVISPTVVSVRGDQSEEEEEETTTSLSEVEEDSEELEGEAGIRHTDTKFEQLKRDGKNKEEDEEEEEGKSIEDERHSAELSFKERLKARFNKFRQEHKGFLNKKNKVETTPITRNRNSSNRFNSDDESDSGEKRERPKFGKSGRTDLIRKKLEEVLRRTSVVEESTLKRTFVPSFLRTETTTFSPRIRPTNIRNFFNVDSSTRSPFTIHRNKGFTRPTIRKNLLNRVLGKTNEEHETDTPETETSVLIASSIDPATAKTTPEPITKSEQPDVSIVAVSPNSLIISGSEPLDLKKDIDSQEPTLQSSIESLDDFTIISTSSSSVTPTPSIQILQPSEVLTVSPSYQGDESTISVATEELEGRLLEVVTIRSAYSFTLGDEESGLSTRYITVTRTQEAEEVMSTINVSTILPETGTRALEVATIKSPYSFQVSESDSVSESTRYVTVTRTFTSDIVTQRDTLASSRESAVSELPFDIIDFNPTPSATLQSEVVSRTAVIPVLVEEGVTSLSTLTQVFTLDIRPSPTLAVSLSAQASTLPGFVDIDADFESGESINRETFLPIDGRFNDQNSLNVNSDDPLGFSDLDSSFVLTPSPPVLSSLTPTPSIPEPSVISLPDPASLQNLFSPEQLSYIQLLQKQIPGLPFQSLPPQVVTLSSSVVRTSTALVTSTLRLLRGNSELVTTLVNPVLTTVTEVSRVTSTLAGGRAPGPATSLVTSPVTFSTTLTQVETESYKVLFRARPITTTVINTRLVPTVITTFATQTLTLPPPLLG